VAAVLKVVAALVATVCAVVLLLGYRTPRPPHDRLADHAVAAPPSARGALRHRCPATTRRSVTGPTAAWSFGHVQVRVTLAGCRIDRVEVVSLATTNPVSQRRSRAAVTTLRGEMLSSQCAAIDVVSGATYTSNAYLHSLQAALDAAHAASPCE
jgi:uncharacterized protein with FMN-binding domain